MTNPAASLKSVSHDALALEPAELAKIAKAYDAEPWWYDLRGLFILTFAYRSTLWAQLRFFARNIEAEHLEVAIGSGTLLDMVLRWRALRGAPASRISGFDYAEAMLAGAARRFRDRSDIALHRADAAELPFSDDSFDSINVANAVHCLPDIDGSLAEMFRVLRPGKCVAMNVLLEPRGWAPLRRLAERINAWGQKKGILHSAYDVEDVQRRVRKVGFDQVTVEVMGNTCHLVAYKPVVAVQPAGRRAA